MTCSIVLVWDFGSVLSAFGLFEQHKMSTVDSFHVDEQQSIYEPLNHIDLENASGQQEGTPQTLNRRPHHLSDSVRHRERMSRSLPLEYIHLGNVLKVPDIVASCIGMNKDAHLLLEGAFTYRSKLKYEYMQINERTSRMALDHFCQSVMQIYGPEYLRKPTVTDVEKLYLHHEEKHGFSGMLGSLDYLWIWHVFFGVAGSNNDINVLYQSLLFNDLKTGRAPEIPFVANGVTYPSGYYLVDGIYPKLAPLVKTIPEPVDDDHKRILYKQKQESTRKDVERAFGVLKKKWAILANPTRALKKESIINMMYTSKIQKICDISQMVPGGSASTGRPVTKRGTSATSYALDQISTNTSKPSTQFY
ncbi:ALP1-like protein [Tanacetum coccineum]|uniref:ALP1-like protein n=1 Tax=Tanacetum coccineum TaxID=301880 RepID=A0ABQ5C1P7_9ASTR